MNNGRGQGLGASEKWNQKVTPSLPFIPTSLCSLRFNLLIQAYPVEKRMSLSQRSFNLRKQFWPDVSYKIMSSLWLGQRWEVMKEKWEEGALYQRRGWKSSVNSPTTTVYCILPFDFLAHMRYPSPLTLNFKMPTYQNVSIPRTTEDTSIHPSQKENPNQIYHLLYLIPNLSNTVAK